MSLQYIALAPQREFVVVVVLLVVYWDAEFQVRSSLMNTRTGETADYFHKRCSMLDAMWLSSSGKQIISLSTSGLVRIWDPETGRSVQTLVRWQDEYPTSFAISGDGQRIVAGGIC